MDNEESILYFCEDGSKRWRNKSGELHRLDGPAVEYENGDKFWYQNGQLHRIDGPAIEYRDGSESWYLRDISFPNKEKYFDAMTDEEKAIALFSEDFHNG